VRAKREGLRLTGKFGSVPSQQPWSLQRATLVEHAQSWRRRGAVGTGGGERKCWAGVVAMLPVSGAIWRNERRRLGGLPADYSCFISEVGNVDLARDRLTA